MSRESVRVEVEVADGVTGAGAVAARRTAVALRRFLLVGGTVAGAVGLLALGQPAVLLATKGVTGEAAQVWMREVGVLLIGVAVLAYLVRDHPATPTLRAILIANLVIQLGLLPVEPLAWHFGVITQVWGIVPNTVVHLALATGFAYFARKMPRA